MGTRSPCSSLCLCWLQVGRRFFTTAGQGWEFLLHWILFDLERHTCLSTAPQITSTVGRAFLLLGSGKGLTPVGLFWFQPIAGKGQCTLLLPGECLSSPCDLHRHQGEENLIFTWQGTALHWPSLTPPWWGVRGSLLQCRLLTWPVLVWVGP